MQNQRRRSPSAAERVVLRQDRAAVQQIEQIERALDPAASRFEGFTQAHINLSESIAVQRAWRDQLRGLGAACDGAAERRLRCHVGGAINLCFSNLGATQVWRR